MPSQYTLPPQKQKSINNAIYNIRNILWEHIPVSLDIMLQCVTWRWASNWKCPCNKLHICIICTITHWWSQRQWGIGLIRTWSTGCILSLTFYLMVFLWNWPGIAPLPWCLQFIIESACPTWESHIGVKACSFSVIKWEHKTFMSWCLSCTMRYL